MKKLCSLFGIMAILFSCSKLDENNPETGKISISVTDIDALSATLSATTSSSKMYFLSMTDKSSWDNEGGDAIWNTNISLLKQQGTLSQALHTGKQNRIIY